MEVFVGMRGIYLLGNVGPLWRLFASLLLLLLFLLLLLSQRLANLLALL
jgi:hypothetical protein